MKEIGDLMNKRKERVALGSMVAGPEVGGKPAVPIELEDSVRLYLKA